LHAEYKPHPPTIHPISAIIYNVNPETAVARHHFRISFLISTKLFSHSLLKLKTLSKNFRAFILLVNLSKNIGTRTFEVKVIDKFQIAESRNFEKLTSFIKNIYINCQWPISCYIFTSKSLGMLDYFLTI